MTFSAFLVCDRIGRIWATRCLCIIWIVGISIFLGANGNLGAVYAGRFIAGLGVGQTPVVGVRIYTERETRRGILLLTWK